jgi:transposase InsO family protein
VRDSLTPSFAVIEKPRTYGVAERVNRTLKGQFIHGRIFHSVEELRVAVAAFVDRYHARWRVEELGFLTPIEARLRQALATAASTQTCVQKTGRGSHPAPVCRGGHHGLL